jgi:ATP-dependent helicase/DNAse subunit B
MAPVGPVGLDEVRLVLSRRLTELAVPPSGRRYGRVFVAPIESARGLSFDVVLVPGLAERMFPQKVLQDPLLRDAERLGLEDLATSEDRVAAERLALRLAAGAAERKLVLSYPRLDLQQARPRVPSFYGLEVLRAAEGLLPSFAELARRAELSGGARIGWPAPKEPKDAIDEAEHDLALLEGAFRRPEQESRGTAHYLLGVNPHLARALRARARRWRRRWTPSDGLVDPGPDALAALRAHRLDARSYSPTALQNYAACPYRFLLQAVHRFAPREEPEAIDEIDPLARGSLVHEVQFELLRELQDAGALPLGPHNLEDARARLDHRLTEIAERYRDDLKPAIDRVWQDGIASVRADLREWLRRAAQDGAWTPWRFELSFGLSNDRAHRDPHSTSDPVSLDQGLRLRGSIDLVERSAAGALRATDYKTGKKRADQGDVIRGGETLQPALYALALEKLFPDVKVEGGRLYYSTFTGEFEAVDVQLDHVTRESIATVAQTIGNAVETGFLPAAPGERQCEWCDYQSVCGPHEEYRVGHFKPKERLAPLVKLRGMP